VGFFRKKRKRNLVLEIDKLNTAVIAIRREAWVDRLVLDQLKHEWLDSKNKSEKKDPLDKEMDDFDANLKKNKMHKKHQNHKNLSKRENSGSYWYW
jgi:hypothetical protein